MRRLFFTLLLTLAASPSFASQGCPMSSDEKLVCSVILCNPIGLMISDSRSECLKVNRDFAIYLATLGFWDKPPKCYARDEYCNRTGRASTAQMSPEYCVDAGDAGRQNACMTALRASGAGYCDQFRNQRERQACESIQSSGQLTSEYCDELIRNRRWGRLVDQQRYEQCKRLYDL